MNRSILTVLSLVTSLGVIGCVHSTDVEIGNPLHSGKVDEHRITRPHSYAEQAHGLPPGSLTDEARLTAMNEAKVCFAFTMHELVPVDGAQIKATLAGAKKGMLERPEVTATPTTMRTYNGLVPLRRQVGHETVCTRRDQYNVCQGWETRPTYTTDMVPGPVNVHELKGNLCFPNRGELDEQTAYLKLAVKVPTLGKPELAASGNPFAMGFAAFAPNEARNEFAWALVGAAKKQ